MSFVRSLSFCLAASLSGVAACGDDGDGPSTEDAGAADAGHTDAGGEDSEAVTIAFKLQAGETPVDCASPVTVAGREVNAVDLRLYISEVALVDADGNETLVDLDTQEASVGKPAFQGDQIALLDFENKENGCSNNDVATNTEVVGQIKPGAYTGVAFSVGVPDAQNHLNLARAKAPLDLIAMSWGWLGGYKFTGIDLKAVEPIALPDGGVSNSSYLVHMGSQACDGTPADGFSCERPNRARIVLSAFDPATDAIVLDLNGLLSGLVIGESQDAVPGCMSGDDDPECPPIFENLGLDPDTGKPSDLLTQKAFRVAEQ